MTPQQASDLIDVDGENLAVRDFLVQYGLPGITIKAMRQHMERSGWGAEYWPPFAKRHSAPSAEHLTKTGAQIWIRHLIGMEPRAPAPTSESGARNAVLHQFRTRPNWNPKAWGVWIDCTQAQHDEKLANPIIGDWCYETRALCLATPASPAVPARITGLLKEALAWIEGSAEPAPSLCSDLRKELGLPPAVPSPAPAALDVKAEREALKAAAIALRDTGGAECVAAFRRRATPSAVIRLIEENEKLAETVRVQEGQLQERWP